ncbi:Rhomboid family intramembrane serine protease [Flavobacterium sp. 9AF]|uniref:rhomboid family intramembrane serine protease n=1 Tax=Flavobacterium sp. 9AF TaxID=2653142 RepID=UPI0012F0829A|nr:rhomboid family intramembrane serine protease [Flavobacterium sp. 9AF]VXB47076.1 Rhomboid family intramembrane serine protease [Flavobacterium sp. 9AF]
MKQTIQDHQFKFTQSVLVLPVIFILLLWIVFVFEKFFGLNFHHYGIYPREKFGLKGIFFSWAIHGNLGHIANNSIALFVLLFFLRFFYKSQSVIVIVFGILFSGLGTWLLGRPSYHIGASGLIYVLVSFIFFKGIFTKYFRLMALSFVIVLLYGGMIWYMFPNVEKGISWEGHLSGFLTGLSLALIIRTPQFGKPVIYDWQRPDFNPENDSFMKNFDDKGNFNPPPKPDETIKDYFTSSLKVIYEFMGLKK